jgi:NitT/TauT family transport system substrate-binding protein
MPRNGKISIYALAGVLAAGMLLLAGYAWMTRSPPAHPAEQLDKVTVAVSLGSPGSCAVVVAVDKGYFTSEGVLLVIQPHSNGRAALDATLRGDADLATVADVPVMFAAMRGEPVSIVAAIFKSDNTYGIVGRKDAGIATPAGLKGKRVGVTVGSAAHFVLVALLNRQKLAASDVTIVDLAPGEMSEALAQAKIDAAATRQPMLAASLERLADNGFYFSAEGLHDGVFLLAAARKYLTDHPRTIEKVLRAVVRGGRFCKDAPDAAREIAARTANTDAAALKRLWPSFRFDVSLDQSLLLALEDESRWAIRSKLTDGADVPNYLNYLYPDALKAVSPAAVTIIR